MKIQHKFFPFFIFISVVFVGIILAPSAGVTWDEPDNIFAGGTYVTFFKEKFNPQAFDGFWDQRSHFQKQISTLDPRLSHYPPFPTYPGSILTIIAQYFGLANNGQQVIIIFHFATVIFFAIFVTTMYYFALLLGLSPFVSIFTAVSAYLYPTLFGHGLTNLKDTAQVSLFTLSLYFLVRGHLVKGAVVWGLGLASKFNLIYVPIIWALSGKKSIKKIILVACIGLCVGFIAWPYLWFDPILRGKDIILYFTSVGRGYTILWDGTLYAIGKGVSYWWYPLLSFFYQTPSLLFIAFFVGLFALFQKSPYRTMRIVLLIWMIIPLLRTLSPWSSYYDGVRHFMEILPAYLLICGIGVNLLLLHKKFSRISLFFAIGTLAQLLFIAFTYFPYSTGYYNAFARDPNVRFDRDIEGLSIKEGIDWLHKSYDLSSIYVPIAAHLSWYYLTGEDRLVYSIGEADTVLLMNKMSHKIDDQYKAFEKVKGNFDLVHTIKRGDAIFGWIYRKK